MFIIRLFILLGVSLFFSAEDLDYVYTVEVYTRDFRTGKYIQTNEEVCGNNRYDNYLIYKGEKIGNSFKTILKDIIKSDNVVKDGVKNYYIQHVFVEKNLQVIDTFGVDYDVKYCLYKTKLYHIPSTQIKNITALLPYYYYNDDAFYYREEKK